MKFLELYISCLIMWSANYINGKIIFNYQKKDSWIKVIITIILFSTLLATINILYFQTFSIIFKFLFSYLLICLFYKILFHQKVSKSLVTSLIVDIAMFASEIILAIIISIVIKFLDYDSLEFLKHTIFINMLNSILTISIIKLNIKKIDKLIKNNNFADKGSFIFVLLLLVIIALLFIRIPLTNWNFNTEFIATMVLLICSCVIGLLLIKQKAEIQETTSMYQQLVEYSDITNNLLEDYRIISHEQKNQLLIIRGMLDTTNKELIDYVDNLLEKRETIKYPWIGQLNHLPISGLKGLINYKLMEMESKKINVNISVSSDISKTRLNKLSMKQKDQLYSIIGVYLDNAIQAANESNKPEISLEIYKEKKDIVIILANTFNGNIELDKLDEYGYTTKGKNHGVGLHIVKKIIDEETIFSQSRKIFQDYYVQELRIHLTELNKIK